MACSLARFANLPIAPEYRKRLLEYLNDPKNQGACEQLSQLSDDQIVSSIQQIETKVKDWTDNGVPSEILNENPEIASELHNTQVYTGPIDQGIGGLPPSQTNNNLPPGQLADVPMPMDVPSPPSATHPSSGYRNGGFVNAPRYGLGGFIGDAFDGISDALGGSGGILGAIVGGALAYMTGGMSLAAGAALGSSAASYIDTGDLGTAATAGATAYTLGSAGNSITGGLKAANTVAGAAQKPVDDTLILAPPAPAPDLISPAPEVKKDIMPELPIAERLPTLDTTGIASLTNPITANIAAPPAKETESVAPVTPSVTTNPLDAYYECVAQYGAEFCQLPDDLSNTTTGPVSMAHGGMVDAIGTETSDSQPAWLSDNEFVMTANAVRGLGNGDINQGAARMYTLMDQLEKRGQ
jgi:hypothetical protein